MTSPRVTHCLFCDDIRQEVGNKLSLMGLYFGEIFVVGKAPQILPKLCVVVFIVVDAKDPMEWFKTTILIPPARSELCTISSVASPPSEMTDDIRQIVLHQIIPISPFPLNEDGLIEVMIETDRGSERAGRLQVRFTEQPTLSQPPQVG